MPVSRAEFARLVQARKRTDQAQREYCRLLASGIGGALRFVAPIHMPAILEMLIVDGHGRMP